ncbi:Isotrichodermin C-15 hydroxylase [Sphaceloma murrayae]|uniref:Isotrichodermin C-15 hydroxylase n=1 Tax=Sphaceloma murrayae TaxID=2082308 RepID=A0A2K1QGI6_9PEZI|nr:Isotrichodermin C-15 hydroxylase [Sphaceloma murrayae]
MSSMFSLLLSPATYAVGGAVTVFCLLVYWLALPTPIVGVPYDKAASKKFAGHAGELMAWAGENETVFDWMAGKGKEIGSPIYQLFLQPFARPTVFVTDPRECQDILLRRSREFDRAKYFTDLFVGTIPNHHIVQPTNDVFRAQRKLLADTMSTGFLQSVAVNHLHNQTLNLLSLWQIKSHLASTSCFEASEDINEMALDTIWAVAFGTDINTIKTQDNHLRNLSSPPPTLSNGSISFSKPTLPLAFKSLMALSDSITAAIRSPSPRIGHALYRLKPAFRTAKAHKDRLVADRLEDAKQRFLARDSTDAMINCATDNMVRREQQAAEKEGREPTYDSPAAKDELFGFLIAGHDTTSTTVMWGVKFLGDRPEMQMKLRERIRGAYSKAVHEARVPTAQEIFDGHVPYLDATIEEVLRVGLTAPGAVRITTCDTQVLGCRIPKGTDVFLLSNGSGFVDEDLFVDQIDEKVRSQSSREAKGRLGTWEKGSVKAFRPERWIKVHEGVEEYDSRSGPTQPFGGGIRGCFGKRLAYLEMKVLFTLLLWKFELLPVPKELSSYKATDNLTHKPRQCYVSLRPLESGRKDSAAQAQTDVQIQHLCQRT